MQWDNAEFTGFSNKTPWIKVNKNHSYLNVATLENDKNSLLNTYRKLIALRNSEPVLQYGAYTNLSFSDGLISFSRTFNGAYMTCYFNFSKSSHDIILNKKEKVLMGKLKLNPNNYTIIKGDN
jgi:trehalose-6-phosphate hydrolase